MACVGAVAKEGGQGACLRGKIVKNRWKHKFTIARESSKEVSSNFVTRKKAKNEIPALETAEILGAAWEEWCTRK